MNELFKDVRPRLKRSICLTQHTGLRKSKEWTATTPPVQKALISRNIPAGTNWLICWSLFFFRLCRCKVTILCGARNIYASWGQTLVTSFAILLLPGKNDSIVRPCWCRKSGILEENSNRRATFAGPQVLKFMYPVALWCYILQPVFRRLSKYFPEMTCKFEVQVRRRTAEAKNGAWRWKQTASANWCTCVSFPKVCTEGQEGERLVRFVVWQNVARVAKMAALKIYNEFSRWPGCTLRRHTKHSQLPFSVLKSSSSSFPEKNVIQEI